MIGIKNSLCIYIYHDQYVYTTIATSENASIKEYKDKSAKSLVANENTLLLKISIQKICVRLHWVLIDDFTQAKPSILGIQIRAALSIKGVN